MLPGHQSEMRRIEREEERKKEAEAKVAAGQSGFLNFNRSMALDRCDVRVALGATCKRFVNTKLPTVP